MYKKLYNWLHFIWGIFYHALSGITFNNKNTFLRVNLSWSLLYYFNTNWSFPRINVGSVFPLKITLLFFLSFFVSFPSFCFTAYFYIFSHGCSPLLSRSYTNTRVCAQLFLISQLLFLFFSWPLLQALYSVKVSYVRFGLRLFVPFPRHCFKYHPVL